MAQRSVPVIGRRDTPGFFTGGLRGVVHPWFLRRRVGLDHHSEIGVAAVDALLLGLGLVEPVGVPFRADEVSRNPSVPKRMGSKSTRGRSSVFDPCHRDPGNAPLR